MIYPLALYTDTLGSCCKITSLAKNRLSAFRKAVCRIKLITKNLAVI